MNTKRILALSIALIIAGLLAWYTPSDKSANEQQVTPGPDKQTPAENMQTARFSGKLEEVNTGCFADAECYITVDGKHITTTIGWNQETVGSVFGVEGFGDLEKHVGEEVEIYAQVKADGSYTLYGSEDFYVKLIGS